MSKPNPECKWCHGTGEIRLVVTTVPCDCVKCDCNGLMTRSERSGGEIVEEVEENCNNSCGDCHI